MHRKEFFEAVSKWDWVFNSPFNTRDNFPWTCGLQSLSDFCQGAVDSRSKRKGRNKSNHGCERRHKLTSLFTEQSCQTFGGIREQANRDRRLSY